MSKYRAPATAKAKVRESAELRHHEAVVMEAEARTGYRVLWPADHTVGSVE